MRIETVKTVWQKGHDSPDNYDRNLFKVIITKITTKGNDIVPISDLISNVYVRVPRAEVWIDLSRKEVTQVLDMPDEIRYEGNPVAIN